MQKYNYFRKGLRHMARFLLNFALVGAILTGDIAYGGVRSDRGMPHYDPYNPKFVPGEILVQFNDEVSLRINEEGGVVKTSIVTINALNARYNAIAMSKVFVTAQKPDAQGMATVRGRRIRVPDLTTIYRIKIDVDSDVLTVIEEYENDPNVIYAEPNYLAHVCVTPNDNFFSEQWGLSIMQAEQGWDIETGNASIPIAIIDTGVDWDHPDLMENIWTNPGEDAWNDPNDPATGNGIDDDGNGYIDDWKGWDFVAIEEGYVAPGEDFGPEDNNPMDFHGHGTHCAGIAGAVTDNHIGIAGVAWNCRIMALRAGYENSSGNGELLTVDVANALHYAALNGARVVNMSFGSYGLSQTMQNAIVYANSLGVVLVAAAGNEGTEVKHYPAGFTYVISVSATDENDQRAIWIPTQPPSPGASSNFGSWVDVAAPGSNIKSTLFDDSYASWSGTSMATPFVSGVAGLILSKNPTLSKEGVRQVIVSTTDLLETDEYIGSGRINSYKALQMDNVPVAEITSPSTDDVLSETISVTGSAYGLDFLHYLLEYGSGLYPTVWTPIINSTDPVIDGTLATWEVHNVPDGQYTLRLSVQDSSGNIAKEESFIIIDNDLHAGWPVFLSTGVRTSSPVVGDLDADGSDEIIITSYDGYVYVVNTNGTIKWLRDINAPLAFVSPALADFNMDGLLEIVFGTFPESVSKVVMLNHDGTDVQGWPQYLGEYYITTPAIGDVDADGQLEIVAATQEYYREDSKLLVYVWKHNGSNLSGWPKEFEIGKTGLDCASTPSIGDIDEDGYLEIVVGFKDGTVHVLNHDGTAVTGWPVDASDHSGFLALTHTGLGDVDNDGHLEIVGIVSGQGFIHVWDRNGNEKPGWPKDISGYSVSPPSLSDLDNDGDLEIIAHSNIDKMYAWHHNGQIVAGWPIDLEERINPYWPPAVIGDIDDDGFPEIIAVSDEKKVHAWHNNGTVVNGWPKYTVNNFSSPAALGDFDGDGFLELVAVEGKWELKGFLGNRIYMWDLSGKYYQAKITWPMFRHDMFHTGLYNFGMIEDEQPPRLIDPVADKSGIGATVWVDWAESAGASFYRVQVDDDSIFNSPEFLQAGIAETRCFVDGLSYSTEYNWRVQGYNPGGLPGNWSEVRCFKTMDEPSVCINYPNEYVLLYLKEGDQYYIDRDYVVTTMPPDLQNLLCIKTANDDKQNAGDSLISIDLRGAATLYVAYDHRAASAPNWLFSEFTPTEYAIQVSDEAASPLNIWSKKVNPGGYVFGGNRAPGAEGDNISNYIMLISCEYFTVSGHVSYCGGTEPVPDIELLLDNNVADTTDGTGYYHLELTYGGEHDISARKTGDLRSAISGADAVTVLNYLAFVTPALNQYQLQAADVTQDSTVTGADATALLRYIAFMSSYTASTAEWIFNPASATVSGPPDVTQDFAANLLGDVTQNWGAIPADVVIPNSLARSSQHKAAITLPDITSAPATVISLPVEVSTDSVVTLAQFVIDYDTTALRLDSVTVGADVCDFSMMINDSLPFAPSLPNAVNVLVQVCASNPAIGFSGDTAEVARLHFFSSGGDQEFSALCVDPDPARTFLTTANLYDMRGTDIMCQEGRVLSPVVPESPEALPQAFRLYQNYPNPFNATTKIRYELPEASNVTVTVHNVLGQEIRCLVDAKQPAGYYTAFWDGKDGFGRELSSGIYIIRLHAGEIMSAKKIILAK